MKTIPPILQVGDVLLSSEILTEKFCCDLSVCKGECCVEGDAGAPVTMEEIGEIEDCLDAVWGDLSASAQAVIDKQGVAYTDQEGDLVTSIVRGKDCVFTYYGDAFVHWKRLTEPGRPDSASLSVVRCIPSVRSGLARDSLV